MRFPHTHYSKGANIRIVTKAGEVVTGKFIEHRSRFIRLSTGKVQLSQIRTMNRLVPTEAGP